MALVVADRVQETTSTTSTSSYVLLGAATGYQSFGAVLANGDTTYYAITNDTDWEVGIGTYSTTGPTLARTTILASSSGGSAVNWGAGVKNIFISYAASKAVYLDASGDVLVADKIVHDGDTNTAIRFPAADTVSIETGGSERFKVENSTITATVPVLLPADPTLALQASTKQYVDTLVASGIHFHQPVRVEATLNLNATYNNGTSGVGATLTNAGTQVALVIDGVTVATNDRVLVYEQTDQTQNGAYVVTNTGSGSTNWVLTRAADADSYVINDANGLSEGSTFFVQQGTTGAGETYTCNTSGVITFGTTNITFAQISNAQIYSAGSGLALTGTVFSNTAPDQTVTLTQGGATTITGTYPNFTITSTDTTYTAGGGIGLTGTTFSVAAGSGLTQDTDGLSHADTSSQGSVDNTGATFIQDVSLDGFGHVTSLASTTITPSLIGAAPTASPVFTGDVTIADKIIHAGDTNTAIRFPAADTVTVETDGAERMRITSTGNVGLGTASPTVPLQIVRSGATSAEIVLSNTTGNSNLFLSTANTGTGTIFFGDTDSFQSGLVQYAHTTDSLISRSAGDIRWQTGGSTERMRITAAGNVGIGTSSPFNDTGYTAIDIRGSTGGQINFGTTSTRYAQISSNATNGLVLNTTAAIPMLFFTNGNERARIDSSGNLGIGTTTPATKLDVNGTANATTLSIGGTAITATAAELNVLDGITATTTELNYVDGVTSAIQTQLNAKGPTGGGTNAAFYENDQLVTTNYTIPSNKNAMSTGPITVDSGVTVTVSSGARYVVI
jgi:hypothetical protein